MTSAEENAEELVARRVAIYGDPIDGFIRIAQVWTGILGFEVQPVQVPLMMAGMKLVRTSVTPDYSDNSDDVDGYMDIFRRLVGDDMVHARTPAEYWAQKEPVPCTCPPADAPGHPDALGYQIARETCKVHGKGTA